MKAFPVITLSEKARKKLAFILIVTHIITVLTSLMPIGCAVFCFKFLTESNNSVVEKYINVSLPWLMVSTGILNLLVSLVGASLCIRMRDVNARNNYTRRAMQLPYICAALFSAICVFGVAIFALCKLVCILKSFNSILLHATEIYEVNSEIKQEAFHNASLSDVPFGCCNMADSDALKPCIPHYVVKEDKHHDSNNKQEHILYDRSCRDALMSLKASFAKVMLKIALVILIIFVVELLKIIGMRFLQTSIYQAIDHGSPESEASGWLFGSPAEELSYEKVRKSSKLSGKHASV